MNKLKAEERISIQLRELYQRFGYLPYKVSKFEEYDLYMRNKSFLESEHVLAFSDMDGKLMALKPDVTLSIIKNSVDGNEPLKVFYAETVYRVPRGAYGFKEIMQTGLEYIGDVDVYAMGEVLMLAARSLEAIGGNWALDIADLGMVSGILEGENVTEGQRAALLSLISEKNMHGLNAQCDAYGLDEKTKARLGSLITVCGPLKETLRKYEEMELPAACNQALEDLRAVADMMELYGISGINLDFSVVNDMNYYNGLIFAGFIEGIPSGVLSGGRYDYLMKRMGRRNQAIGFAVYLDQLERLMRESEPCDVDVLITYTDDTPLSEVIAAAEREAKRCESVRVQRAGETAIRSRRRIEL